MKPLNLVEMVFRTVQKYGQKDALMAKDKGVYKAITYDELWERVAYTAHALVQRGVGKGDKVAILADNNPYWAISDLAIMSIGAVSVPIHSTLPSDQVSYILHNSASKFIFVGNESQFKKIDSKDFPHESIVIYDSPEKTALSDMPSTMEAFMASGQGYSPEEWQKGFMEIKRADLATIIHTSGTTGKPKGAMLTHGNILANVEGVQFWVLECRPDDLMLSHLPLSHIFERMAGQFFPLYVGATIAYAESIDTVQDNLLEVRPTVLVSVPLLFERVYAQALKMVESGTPIRKKVFKWALGVGEERYRYYLSCATDELMRKAELPKEFRRRWKISERLVYQKVKRKLGGRIRGFISGGGALNPEIGRFFWSVDLPVLEGYGLTETAPVICVNPFSRSKVGTVGKPLPNLDIRLAADGEVLVKGPSVMSGYYRDPQATAEAFEGEWFKTGDIGLLDEDGYLRIIDRKKRILVLTTGKNVAPQPVENALHQSPYIENAVLVGQNRKYVIALLAPDFINIKEWCRHKGIHGSPQELLANKHVQALLTREVKKYTKGFARYEQPKKLIFVNKEWTVETGELTPSLKVRYAEVEKKFKHVIDHMYTDTASGEMDIAANETAVGISLSKVKGEH
ncbi:long-chain fatty acid--CoA ligase [Pradoshia eiseniae]|uniref:Long-chain fatty acid--CoA ligase n=1 Tax=Pradoshia eiseniae TaxID=2064768 RepID=A0A2S7MZ91_9BACI|nr:long-chain fatty acid--CoA ligase [Pradoshia eiseniae]PQD95114.1 long-chain fatty acid--CoA ligase [Pradoshia eiseniae]